MNGKSSKAKTFQRVATSALDAVQKHFAKDPPKPVATRAQNGILKNIQQQEQKKDKSINQNQSQSSAKSARSDVSEPSLYMTALETTLVHLFLFIFCIEMFMKTCVFSNTIRLGSV